MEAYSWLALAGTWVLAPLLPGVINRVKAKFAGRRGQPVLQAYFDVLKLLRKGFVYSRTSGPVFRTAPLVALVALGLASLMVPWGALGAPLGFAGDFIAVAYLLGLARFATALAALDVGSSFEGMGASREVQFAALAEPILLLGMLLLAVKTGRTGLSGMAAHVDAGVWRSSAALLVLLSIAWLILLLAENSRIPVDDPNTHLELTMIHEVMILDYAGPDLGIMLYAASLKLWLFCALIAAVLAPLLTPAPWLAVPAFVATVLLVAAVVGVVESVMGRLRLNRVPKLLIGSSALLATALILEVVS